MTLTSPKNEQPFAVRLEMEEAGWAKLHLYLGDKHETVDLSYAFDPFPYLIDATQMIENGDLPVLTIDEEGTFVVFDVQETDDPAQLLLRVTREYTSGLDDKILFEGVVERAAMASALKKELRRFFTEEFNPQEWDVRFYDPEDNEDGHVYLHERIQGNQWLWGKTGE